MRYFSILLALLLGTSSSTATTIRVPADSATIQAGINGAVNGDTVLVEDGAYTGAGNRDMDYGGKLIVVTSENGPENTIVDLQNAGRAFYFHNGEDSSAVLQGITIRNGYTEGHHGGAVRAQGGSPRIINCHFEHNSAYHGGALYANTTDQLQIINCRFVDNSASGSGESTPSRGGALFIGEGDPSVRVTGCIFDTNSAVWGGAIVTYSGSITTLQNCTILNSAATAGAIYREGHTQVYIDASIIAFTSICGALFCESATGVISLTCCDIYDNDGGDWTSCIADQAGENGNFSLDPEICFLLGSEYSLYGTSPCAASHNACGVLVGALGVGCPTYEGPVWYASTLGDDYSGNGSIDFPFATIQRACDVASDNDTVIVTPGTYGGAGNRDITFYDKRLHVLGQEGSASTIIDVQGGAFQGFSVLRSIKHDSSSTICGLTIRNAMIGIQVEQDAVRLLDIHAENCSAAGMVLNYVYPIEMMDCQFSENHDGLFLGEYPSYGVFDRCTFLGNVSRGIYIHYLPSGGGASCIIRQSTFSENGTGIESGGRSQVSSSAITVDSCRFERNAIAIKSSGQYTQVTVAGNDCAVELYYHYCEFFESTFSGNDVDLARLGSLYYDAATELKLIDCEFSGNAGGIIKNDDQVHRYLTMSGCLFHDNSGSINLYPINACRDEIYGNTFIGNLGDVFVVHEGDNFSADLVFNNVVAFNHGRGLYGDGVLTDNVLSLSCNNVFANAGGDYGGELGDSTGYSGNVSADPMFCDTADGDFSILNLSPCSPTNNSCSTLIGAYGVGCYAPAISSVTVDPDADNLHVVSHQPSIVWNYYHESESQQTQSEIEVGTDNDWAVAELWDFGPQVSADTAATYAGDSLYDGQTYHSRVRAFDGTWWSLWYETSFRMNTIPAVAAVLSPEDGGVSGLVPELWITNAADPEADSLSYDFELYMDLAMEWIVKDTQGVQEQPDSTGWNTGLTMTDNEPFWWRSRSYDGYEYSEWSDLAVFYVNGTEQPPTAPETILPPDTSGLPVWEMLPTFSWSEASDPDPFDTLFYYMLEIAVDSNFMYKNDIDSIWATNYELADSLLFNTRYWWRVSACDATDLCTASEPGNFWTWTLGDMDHSHVADITDLSILIDNQFLTLTPIYPAFVADVTGDCAVDISDVSRFIDHLFLTLGPLEVGCE